MINSRVKRYCKEDISLIENYDKAINDTTQTWHCHHRDEVKILPSGMKVIRSYKDLKENGRYYGRPANELIFLTKSEHRRLHKNGAVHSEETRKKMSESHKGKLKGRITSVFSTAFYDHFGMTRIDNEKLYNKEYAFYKYHGHFSWEV